MKKFVVLFIAVMFTVCVSAANGDIAGTYYATDIVTLLNGTEIDSINIGGKTLISAEDMRYYGFRVYWSSESRTLHINSYSLPQDKNPPEVKKENKKSGSVLGHYYQTDIITYLDGEEILSYNLGGRTYIYAEQMRTFGHVVNWDGEKRILDITSASRAGYEYTIALSKGIVNQEQAKGSFSILYTKDKITATDDANYFHSSFSCYRGSYSIRIQFYQNLSMFVSDKLFEKLELFKSSDVYGYEADPKEKYEIIDKSVIIEVNGIRAKNVTVSRSGGNGHTDYTFSFDGIEKLKLDEITSVYFALDPDENAEE